MAQSSTASPGSELPVDELQLVYKPEDGLFTGRVLYNDSVSSERGAVVFVAFEKISFPLMLARLAEHAASFLEKDEKIGVTIRREDLPAQPAYRLSEEMVNELYTDPVAFIRAMNPSPTKVFLRRVDPATTSPLRVGYDAIAATLGDEVYCRRRADQVECPCCGRWAKVGRMVTHPESKVLLCKSAACGAKLSITLRSDRWASVLITSLLADQERDKFFLPREWNKPGPWVTRKDLENKYKGWLSLKEELK